jgi:hypothetical protein
MRKFIIFIILLTFSFAFEVEFTKVYSQNFVPNQDAIFIKTKSNNLTFPFKYKKVPDGYILIGNTDEINLWLENNFYAPKDTEFKDIKIAYVNADAVQYKIITQLKNTYKKCKIKKVIFLSPDENKIITQPEDITFKYKVLLDCN